MSDYAGGCDGKRGVNTLVSADGKENILPGKTSVEVKPGVCGNQKYTETTSILIAMIIEPFYNVLALVLQEMSIECKVAIRSK